MDFTIQEKIELILNFYTFVGYSTDNVDGFPEAVKFTEAGFTCFDDEALETIKMNERGEEFLHNCIKEISKEFIAFMNTCKNDCSVEEIIKWFNTKYKLDDIELGKEIAEYICFNLEMYGYKAKNIYSSRFGKHCIIEKI